MTGVLLKPMMFTARKIYAIRTVDVIQDLKSIDNIAKVHYKYSYGHLSNFEFVFDEMQPLIIADLPANVYMAESIFKCYISFLFHSILNRYVLEWFL